MIVPNLLVTDMSRSIVFYRDRLGMKLSMIVTAEREARFDGSTEGAVFATLEWKDATLMLQTAASLAEDLPELFDAAQAATPSGTTYFRGFDPDGVAEGLPADSIVKGPELSWYGMYELYLRDPDGHIVCLGAPRGTSPD